MASSPKKKAKTTTKSTKSAKSNSPDTLTATPTKPFLDASNTLNIQPPTTPRLIDFKLDETSVHGGDDGWSSSDDSFEEKITWSRHRMRVTPGGFTPRNIQEVRRRLNLQDLPEDQSPSMNLKSLPASKTKPVPASPHVRQFKANDPTVLPAPSPKKDTATKRTQRSSAKTSGGSRKDVPKGALPATTQTMANEPSAQNPGSRRVTQAKEFTFATDARSRRSSPTKARERCVIDHNTVTDEKESEDDGEDVDAVRNKLRELGAASIVAWGETRGRYLDD